MGNISKTCMIWVLVCLCHMLFAAERQIPGTISVREANNPSGKILDMEQTILSRDLSPAMGTYVWKDGHSLFRIAADRSLNMVDFRKDMPEKPAGTYRNPAHRIYAEVDGSENVTAAPSASGDASLYAFTVENNLYVCDTLGNIDTVFYSEHPYIVSGQSVSRNEFGISGGIFWSPDATHLAFYVKDEKAVTEYPLLDITTRTGGFEMLRYPMAGMDSEKVRVMLWNPASGKLVRLDHETAVPSDWARPHEVYLTNVSWSPDGKNIYIQMLDRSQKHMRLCRFDLSGNYLGTVLAEDSEKYVEPLDPLYFINGRSDMFIYRTANRDSYRNLYLCDAEGNIRRLTVTDADVHYVADDGEYVYYTSAEVSPIENHLFRIRIRNLDKGVTKASVSAPQRLTYAEGWHEIRMSPDCRYYLDSYSSLSVPGILDLCSADGRLVRNIETAADPTLDFAYSEISLGKVRSADGKYDNYYRLIKPKDFDPSKKYPLIVYVYGGPHSQMVRNTFMGSLRRWEMYMAQRGYMVYVQDNRGTQNRGLEFEQAIHRRCGQEEMADQIEGLKKLMELPYVDSSRIGVHGWSYGGFMTISLASTYPDIFKVAVAGGPVIDWKWYEVMYGERYMDHPDVNPEGYKETSLIGKAGNIKGKLLVCQGVVDPVVVWQHCLNFIQECINRNVQVDFFPYPRAEHNMFGKERVHLYDKVSMYFEDYL